MSTAFVRQLGAESGVQLNPLRDASDVPTTGNADQAFGIMMRATRGRIDRPFPVDRGNVLKKLGHGEQMRISALNEAWVHVHEALNKGAQQAVVQRLVTPAAQIKWLVALHDVGSNGLPTGSILFQVMDDVQDIREYASDFFAEDYVEQVDNLYLLSLRHLECHNDGIAVELHADENKIGGVAHANDRLTLRLRDKGGNLLYEFTGSLKSDATDDYGNSAYLPDVIASQTDAVVVDVMTSGNNAIIDTNSVAYGYDINGNPKFAKSDVLITFDEGGTSYHMQDYVRCRESLQHTPHDYAYISSGGTKSPAHLAQLAQLAFDTNRQLRFDIPGDLSPEAAIAFAEQLNMGASQTAHLMHQFWSPLKSDDPTGINPKGHFGTATLNIAYACGRNAQKNSKGFAPKNYPIAGREWPVQRTGIVQTYAPRSQELSALARAKINPVVFETYTGGGRYVYRDSLTAALVESSLKKLIAVADMSTSIDEAVACAGRDMLQLPMELALKRMRTYLSNLFEGAQAAGWLVPSDAPEMQGKAWVFEVLPNAQRPYDTMDVSYWLRYDGTVRQIYVTQTLTR